MPQSPLVSVIMPAYNAARFIEQAVESVVAQTYTHWELLIVNDCSTDTTSQMIHQLMAKHSQIRFFDQKINQGVAKTRNIAIDAAAADYIAFLDSDDIWLPNKLEKQLAFMEQHQASVCFSAYQRIDADNNDLNQVKIPAEISYKQLLKSNFIGNLTGIYNVNKLGKCRLEPVKHEDYVAWLKLVKQAGKAYGINEVLARYRVYGQSTSSNKLKTIAWQWKIYRTSQKLNMIQSLYYMSCYAYYAIQKRT